MKRIGVDATAWYNQRGYGRHARALLSALVELDRDHQYVFLLDQANRLDGLPTGAEVRQIAASLPTVEAASANGRRSIKDMWLMSRALSSAEFSVALFPTVYSYVPVLSRAKTICIIHDLIPEFFPQMTFPRRSARIFWSIKTGLARLQADRIVTVSDYSRGLILQRYRLAPDRVAVVGEAPDPIFRPLSAGENRFLKDYQEIQSGRFLLYVGGFGPHKNIETLIKAFAQVVAQAAFRDLKLALVGEYQKETFFSSYPQLKALIAILNLEDSVRFTGYLADSELVLLLNTAQALVLPSFMEGFGLPAMEAAACGCPVIATTASPLPQILGQAGIFVDPHDQTGLERAIIHLLESPELCSQLGAAGLLAASKLTWAQAAQQLKAIIDQFA